MSHFGQAIFVLIMILMPAIVLGAIAIIRGGTDDIGDRSIFLPTDRNGKPEKF